MNWKVPTRLIVDEPSYQQQKKQLLVDSGQKFYEDINGTKKYSSTGHEVLDEVSQMRRLNPDELAGPYRHLARSSTTHHVPPYGMLKQMREKDIEEECRMMSTRQRRPTPGPGGPKLPPMASNKLHQDLSKGSMSRNLRARAIPAAEQWLRGAGSAEKTVINKAMLAADNDFMDRTLNRSLQPDAKKSVEKWMATATETDRGVALEFFGSLAGSKLMGAREGLNHDQHKDHQGKGTCKICDGDRLNQVIEALKRGNNPIATVTLRKDVKHGKPRHIRLLTPQTRATKDEYKTWHHLPVYKHKGPVSNSIALFTRPHRPIPRHFTIHPEWE